MSERMIEANGIRICTQPFGRREDPTVLLVMGGGASMLLWEDAFCDRLARGGRHVIRYDHRDTGRSTHLDIEQTPYTLADMAADAAGVLDAYEIESAHIVGTSLGGMIAQHIALEHPDRVRTLTLLMSSPDLSSMIAGLSGQSTPPGGLPGPTADVVKGLERLANVDWSNPDSAIGARVEYYRVLAGPAYPLDEMSMRQLFAREIARTPDMSRSLNHQVAAVRTPSWLHRLVNVGAPTLVIHGSADPILPSAHGEALARMIPDARLLLLPRAGHALPEPLWPDVISAILQHTTR